MNQTDHSSIQRIPSSSNPLEVETQSHVPGGKKSRPVSWYRTPLDREAIKKLHARSDLLGCLQTFGYLGVLVSTGSLAWYSSLHWPWWTTVPLIFLHGTGFAFQINAVHELGHGTVFKTPALNAFFEQVFAFLGWVNFQHFDTSHVQHHRFTLHPPEDLEVVLPARYSVKDFLKSSFLNLGAHWTLLNTIRLARGRFKGDWELTLFPESNPLLRSKIVNWSRFLLIGHGLIISAGICTGCWQLPILISLAPFYGGWLQNLCNNTQHIGLQDNVPDFRLCCRTMTLNPVVQFLYWHMNFHTEHHMYAAVPCYRLGKLHKLIRHDLPRCPHGLIQTWREIAAIQEKQDVDPSYQFMAQLPARPDPDSLVPQPSV